MKETDVAKPVVEWLRAEGWDVYQEVAGGYAGDYVADIVAVHGRMSWVIECKTARTLAVLEQALRWTTRAHMVAVATPLVRRGRGLWRQVCQHFGVGWLGVHNHGRDVEVLEWPQLRRNLGALKPIAEMVHEEQRTMCPAGSANGGHYTPFRATADRLRAFVSERPGEKLSAIFRELDHHYSSRQSACSAMRRWIAEGSVEGVRIDNGRVYPVGPATLLGEETT